MISFGFDPRASGYLVKRQGATTLIYSAARPGLAEAIPARGPIGRPAGLSGRTQVGLLEPDMVVRPLVHGGALRRLTGNCFLGTARSRRELLVSRHLSRHGVPTPEVLALRFIRTGLCTRIDVITRLVPDSTDLLTFLRDDCGEGAAIFAATGRLVRGMHDLGVWHADLHLKNILLDAGRRPLICDLDKARKFHYLPFSMKAMNIRRFFRSCRKWQAQGLIVLPAQHESIFLAGYHNERHKGEPS